MAVPVAWAGRKALGAPPVKEAVTVMPRERAEKGRAKIPGRVKGKAAAKGKGMGAVRGRGQGRLREKGKVLGKAREKALDRGGGLTARRKARGRTGRRKKVAGKVTARAGKGKALAKGKVPARVSAGAVPAGKAGAMTMTPAAAVRGRGRVNNPGQRRPQRANPLRNRQRRRISRRSKKGPNNLRA
jgi:hypothetical protein